MSKYSVIRREYIALDGTKNYAVYSECENYRYWLARYWDMSKPILVMIMLNPSTATERENDPTVERCERRARNNGFGGLVILNIFAFRATDPQDMRRAGDPIGAMNNSYIENYIEMARLNDHYQIVCGWGTHGDFQNRADLIYKLFERAGLAIKAFKWTKEGHPQHPLYISYNEQPKVRQK